MKQLIIGGAGYIGGYYAKKLLCNDVDFTIVDSLICKNEFSKFYVQTDYELLKESFLKEFDVIVLLAGKSSVGDCTNLMTTFFSNVVAFSGLIEKLNHVWDWSKKLIYASSASVYGNSGERLCVETDRLSPPTNLYDMSKQQIEQIASFAKFQTYGLRFGTVVGWYSGQRRVRFDTIVNKLKRCADKHEPFVVYGPHLNRSILFNSDCANAIMAIANSKIAAPGVYNVSSFNATIAEIAGKFVKHVSFNFGYGNEPLSDYNFRLSCEKLQKTFNVKFDARDLTPSMFAFDENL